MPLGFDTFGVALALGLAGLPPNRRLHISLLFAAFEAGMPLLGVALGAPLGDAVGNLANYLAAALVAGLGVYMLLERSDEVGESERLLAMTKRGAYGFLALGFSISLDEIAIGFSAGLLRLPLPALVISVGVQAFVLTQIGVRLGSRASERWREVSERVAGGALVLLGAVLLLEQASA